MSKQMYLFIGGPYDGERIYTDGEKYFRAAKIPKLTPIPTGGLVSEDTFIKHGVYRKEEIKSRHRSFHVYVLKNLNSSEMISYLIKGYRRVS